MISTLVADTLVAIDFGPVENGVAMGTLRPESFGYRPLGQGLGADFGGYQFVKPTHFIMSLRVLFPVQISFQTLSRGCIKGTAHSSNKSDYAFPGSLKVRF